jgi:hypothetical protein
MNWLSAHGVRILLAPLNRLKSDYPALTLTN